MLDKLWEAIVALWDYLKPIVFVMEYQEAVVFRGGIFHRALKKGTWIKIPFVDDYHIEHVKPDTMSIHDISITTLDNFTITIGGEFEFYISDIIKALVETNDWRSNMQDISQGILSNELEDIKWEDIKRKTTKNRIEREIAKRALEMGVTAYNFNFTNKTISKVFKLFNTDKSTIIN